MKNILITGGTVFVSKFIAEYYVKQGFCVYVLNRGTKEQVSNVHLIKADRHNLRDVLNGYHFDIIIDVTAYTGLDIVDLLENIDSFDEYIMISSSAVYPEYEIMPFNENTKVGQNKYWKQYGLDKIDAEQELIKRVPDAYIIRPPYLYGPMNNIYREAFVFDCALNNRKFYIPLNGNMKLQFFYIGDLCRFIDIIINDKPENHIFNVGNSQLVSVKQWVELCYKIAGRGLEIINVYEKIEQRNYFSFYDYEYCLDVLKQYSLMQETTSLALGLKKSFEWYINHRDEVNVKPYMQYIDKYLR